MIRKQLFKAHSRRLCVAGMKAAGGFVLLGVSVLTTACSHDESNGMDNAAVSFHAAMTAVTRTTDSGNAWADGDKVGIFMVRAGGTLPGDILTMDGIRTDNREYDVNPATGGLTPASGTPLYYPQSAAVDFIAYYPYTVTTGTGTGQITTDGKYALTVDGQTDAAAQNKLDVLYAKTKGVSKTKTTVNLQFNHALSKITFNVTAGEGIETTDIRDMTASQVVFSGMPLTATLDLQEGSLVAGAVGDFNPMKAAIVSGGAAATFTALVVPQTANALASRTVVFTVGGIEPLIWTIPDTEAFVAGQHYTYPVKVMRNRVEVGSPTISSWTTNDNGIGELVQVGIQPEANSYMVTHGGPAVLIPVSWANKVTDQTYNLGAETAGLGEVRADNYTVELVWADLPVGAGGVIKEFFAYKINNEGYIYVEPGVEGNAVIGIKLIGEQTYRWSWHIWVTEPVSYATDDETGLTWMDRNLGACVGGNYDPDGRNGLFYQWGRKDAFPGSDGTNNNQIYYTPASPNGTSGNLPTDDYTELPDMVQNPLIFTTNYNDYNGSINRSDIQNNSWGGVTGEKTIYDPCPHGWKVPPITISGVNTWGSTSSMNWPSVWNNGRVFNGLYGTSGLNHFYPAGGYRNANSQLYAVGTHGQYWSSSARNESMGYIMNFTRSGIYPFSFNKRMLGHSIRCVRE